MVSDEEGGKAVPPKAAAPAAKPSVFGASDLYDNDGDIFGADPMAKPKVTMFLLLLLLFLLFLLFLLLLFLRRRRRVARAGGESWS